MTLAAGTALQQQLNQADVFYATCNWAAYVFALRTAMRDAVLPVQHLSEHLSKQAVAEMALGQVEAAVSLVCTGCHIYLLV